MGNLGFKEILLIAIVALIFFGPSKLPELGKALGLGIREFKKATREDAGPEDGSPPSGTGGQSC
jgi:sec-independent protein translocase protein TatA